MVTITWEHSGSDAFWFVVELESPGAAWYPDVGKRVWSITGLQAATTYRFRVGTVHAFDRSYSEWVSVTTLPAPATKTTPPPPPDTAKQLPAYVGAFEALGFPGKLMRHRNSLGEISDVSSDLDRADATFRIRPVGNDTVRLEATNFPGHFLRHQHFRILLHKDDGSDLFRLDSTFKVSRSGLFAWARLESVNFPGHFIRHRNFELWVDPDDGSSLFDSDSSWRRLPPPQRGLAPGAMSIQSTNFPDRFIRHRHSLGFLDHINSDLGRRDATFIIRRALLTSDDPKPLGYDGQAQISVSLESVNFPGSYLRHQDFRIKLQPYDGQSLFRQDASFMFQGGSDPEGTGSFSLEAANLPGHFVRHSNFELWLAKNDGSDLFARDGTWDPAPSLLG